MLSLYQQRRTQSAPQLPIRKPSTHSMGTSPMASKPSTHSIGTSPMAAQPSLYSRMSMLNSGVNLLDGVAQTAGAWLPPSMKNWVQGVSSGLRGVTNVGTAAAGIAANPSDHTQYAGLVSGLGGMTSAVGKVGNNFIQPGQYNWAN